MRRLRQVLPVLCIAGLVTGGVASMASAQGDGAGPAGAPSALAGGGDPVGGGDIGGEGHHHHGPGMLGPMGLLLHKLDLSDAQRSQIKSIMSSEKSEFEALRASTAANHEALAKTPPTDAAYDGLIQTAQSNASNHVALLAKTWKQIYTTVLTPEQKAQIPTLVAQAEARRAERLQRWQSRHANGAAPAPTE